MPLLGIKEYAKKWNWSCWFGKNNYHNENGIHVKSLEDSEFDEEVAKGADFAIVFVKADSREEYGVVEKTVWDRLDFELWHGVNELLEKVARVNKNKYNCIN